MFLDNLFTEEIEHLILVVLVFKDSIVQVMLWDLSVAIPNHADV